MFFMPRQITWSGGRLKKWLILFLTFFLVIVFILSSLVAVDKIYDRKFYPSVSVTGVNLGGLTIEQAEKIFKAKIGQLNRNGQVFFYQDKYTVVYPVTISPADPDLIYELITFRLDKTLEDAYQIGRDKNFLKNLWQKIKLPFINKNLNINFELKEEEIKKILINNFAEFEKPGQNPKIIFYAENGLYGTGQEAIDISQKKTGVVFDYQQAIKDLESNLANLNFQPVELKLRLDNPDFSRSEALFLVDEIEQILNLTPIQVCATTSNQYLKTWLITKKELKKWLDLGWQSENKKPALVFKKDLAAEFLSKIKEEIDQPVKEAKFKIEAGKVIEFQPSQPGQEVDIFATLDNFENKIIKEKKKRVGLVIKKIEPQVTTEDVNQLGIKQLIGRGQSNFSGSPKNRRHNIKIGAQQLNGLLIKPHEEFSLNNALGKITADKGYLPELVIKGNKTIPEYGGGLCQIATTMFRLAINTGLEITERKPHAYRVPYYEPAGTDATIYSPQPDLKFINDTPAHLLLQTKIKGDELIFEFWGTHDGRKVSTTTPKIFNITYPGATKYIETQDLEPEKIKCIESAHKGADAEFVRTIIYADGQKKEEVWKSHYRPWQAVCLVGVKKDEEAINEE